MQRALQEANDTRLVPETEQGRDPREYFAPQMRVADTSEGGYLFLLPE